MCVPLIELTVNLNFNRLCKQIKKNRSSQDSILTILELNYFFVLWVLLIVWKINIILYFNTCSYRNHSRYISTLENKIFPFFKANLEIIFLRHLFVLIHYYTTQVRSLFRFFCLLINGGGTFIWHSKVLD